MALQIESIRHDQIIEMKIKGKAFTRDEYLPIIQTVKEHLNNGITAFVFNLEHIEVLNSLGLNALIQSFTQIRNSGGELYIVNISSKINQVLLLTKLNTVLNIATSFENAVELLKK